jgi:AraC-like DNA-binding protein
MTYDEHPIVPGVEVWTSTGAVGEQRILPDGCLDLIFDGTELLVAGPDSTARVHVSGTASRMTGVRLHAGRGPVLLGVPADELSDRSVPLDGVWGSASARELTERVAEGPVSALGEWARRVDPDPFGFRLRALLASGRSVAAAADALGWSTRQLQRRTLPVFGYGPQHLRRVLRLLRAVDDADRGLAWTDVAQRAGFADQAHLARDVKALTGVTPTQLRRERVRSVQDVA